MNVKKRPDKRDQKGINDSSFQRERERKKLQLLAFNCSIKMKFKARFTTRCAFEA
jgi:hypothetical protein